MPWFHIFKNSYISTIIIFVLLSRSHPAFAVDLFFFCAPSMVCRQCLLIFCLKCLAKLTHVFAAGCGIPRGQVLFQTWQTHIFNHLTKFGLKIANVSNHCKFLRDKCLIFLVNIIQPFFANGINIQCRIIARHFVQSRF